ncbi:MAG: hypothetical protein J1E85_03500 [Ruminococcus sp.]|nr:hypothetical protein [Ruminococcus sp.]
MNNNKKKAIKVFAVFIVLVILATVISNIASDFTKVKVMVQKTSRQSINHNIDTEGMVITEINKLITVPEDLLIENIYVKEGQSVSSEDILFSIESGSLEKQIKKIQNLLNASSTLANATLIRAQEDYNEAVSEGQDSVTESLQAYNNAKKEYENYKADENYEVSRLSELEQAVENTKVTYESAVKNRKQSIKDAERALEDAKNSSEYNNIEEYKSKIDELNKIMDNNCNIFSGNNGIVQEILIKNGESTLSNSAIILALDSDKKSVVFDVDKSMRDYVNKDSSVSVSGYNSENEYCVYDNQQIYKIYNNSSSDSMDGVYESDANTNKVVVKLQNCNFSVLSTVNIKMENNSEKYEYCVPVDAIMQDGDNYFVYIVSKKNGLLGEETVAKHVDVEIADKDSQYAAIKNGEILYEEDIICGIDKVIEDGTKIKIFDEKE